MEEKNPRQSTEFNKTTLFLAAILILSYGMSWLAKNGFVFDLFSHFTFQYALGALILCGAFIYLRDMFFACVMFIIFALNAAEMYNSADSYVTKQTYTESDFKIAIYNRNYAIKNHQDFIDWAREESPDFISLIEASTSHSNAALLLKDIYPHQIHEPRSNAFGQILLSKHPIIDSEVIRLKRHALDNILIRAVIKPDSETPISIYSVHPPPPTSALLYKQRNEDLMSTAKMIWEDENRNVIMLGDWNITPYSPHFDDLKMLSGLKYKRESWLPVHSWPSNFIWYPFQIPIDHILFKGDLNLKSYARFSALGSDHYPIIANFAFRD